MKTPLGLEVLVVRLEGFEDRGERGRDLLDVRVLLGSQLVQVLVDRLGGLDLVLHAVEAWPIRRAEKARYGFEDGSGARNSTRLAFGFEPVIGMRIAAERLRCE